MEIWQEWALELEDVYAVDREGETDEYSRYRTSLDNRMLLWHGKVFHILSLVSREHFEEVLTSKFGMVMVLETSFSLYCIEGQFELEGLWLEM